MAVAKELEVQCLLCKEIIKCQHNATSKLVDHVKLKHPDIKITNLPKELNIFPNWDRQIIISKSEKQTVFPKLDKQTREKKIEVLNTDDAKVTGNALKKMMEENNLLFDCDGNNIPKYTENDKRKGTKGTTDNLSKQVAKRKRLYKTSVETWKPGRDKILCPKCNAIVRPIIRKSADRVSHSSVGAALIMTCWPFCFFPFLFPAPVQENLHCSICGFYFGTYDYEKQTMNVSKQSQQRKTENVGTAAEAVSVVEKQDHSK